jgi:hypothetical protein
MKPRFVRAKELYESLQIFYRSETVSRSTRVTMLGRPVGARCTEKPSRRVATSDVQLALRLDHEAFVDYELANTLPLPDDFHHIKRSNIA